MTQKISKELKCIIIRGGVQIWIESDRAENLQKMLDQPNCPQFIEYEGRSINRADLVGVFKAIDLEDKTRRGNGQWKCQHGNWHDRGDKCECIDREQIERNKRIAQRMANCDTCKGSGWVNTKDGMAPCTCQKE